MNRKLNWKYFFFALAPGVLAFPVYLATLAPTITWRNNGADSGDLVTAAYTFGIPHPPGYPLYTLLAAFFAHLPFGEPAQNVAAFSALAASLAIIFLARAGYALLSHSPSLTGEGAGGEVANWVVPVVALMAAFAPGFWSQATIAEVNALAACLAIALFAVLLSDSPRRIYYAAAILGLGLAHHLTIVIFIPSAIILLMENNLPQSDKRIFSVRSVIKIISIIFVPLLLYLYLPLRASAHPPVNWGNPETWDGFSWVVSGAAYRSYLFNLTPNEILARVGLSIRHLFTQFTFVGVALGVWGALRMATDVRTRRIYIALLMAILAVIAYTIAFASRDSFVYLVLADLFFALWIMVGASDVLLRFPPLTKGRVRVGFLLLLLPLYNFISNFNSMNISNDTAARDYAQNILNAISSDAIVLADGDDHYFALMYVRHVLARDKKQIIVSSELLQYGWYFDNIRHEMPKINSAPGNLRDRLDAVIGTSITQARDVYVTFANDSVAAYTLEPRGAFYRVLKKEK